MDCSRLLLLKHSIFKVQYITYRSATKLRNKWLPLDRKWREEHGLPKNSNSFGPLTNLPDYTFLDGRSTPLGSNQRKRLLRQQEIAEKIVTMCRELDDAKKNYREHQKQKEIERNQIMTAKLKPKGKLLLETLKTNKPLQ